MRISSLAACLILAACSGKTDNAQSADAETVVCALEGKPDFSPVCTVQRTAGDRGMTLMISGPGGSFRRLLVTNDGRGVIAADGAEAATVSTIGNGHIEVALGGDRYRLPATIKPSARKTQ